MRLNGSDWPEPAENDSRWSLYPQNDELWVVYTHFQCRFSHMHVQFTQRWQEKHTHKLRMLIICFYDQHISCSDS